MIRLIVSRVLWSIPLLVVVSLLVFILQALTPGDIARTIAGLNATPADVAAIRHALHLDDPVAIQYLDWASGAVRGDLGASLSNNESVGSMLAARLPVTLSLVISGTIIAAVVGVGFGILSARGGRISRIVSDILSIAGMALPGFFIALVLIAWFAVDLGWFPANGYVDFLDDPSGWAASLVLPAIGLAFGSLTSIAKITREGMLDVMQRDFVRNLRANGMSPASIVLKHALRSASLPLVTVIALGFVSSLSSAVVLEQIFGLPGLGSLAVSATFAHDIPVIQGVALFFTFIVIGMNLLLDITYGLLNPRVRHA